MTAHSQLKEIKKLHVLSTSLVIALINACIALLQGTLVAVSIPERLHEHVLYMTAGYINIPSIPPYLELLIAVATVVFIGSLLVCVIAVSLYNLFARYIGGIKVQID